MIDDFRIAIGAAWQIKQEMMEWDLKHIWPYHLPELAATNDQIRLVESQLGYPIDTRYKAFLLCANGWPGFYQTVDLFGTKDLVEGDRKENSEVMLSLIADETLTKSGVNRSEILPIAATELDRDLFVITTPHCSSPGTVLWFAGEEIDRFSSFDDFFLAMMEYNRRELKKLRDSARS